jgi:hypothetical protein
MLAMFRVRDGWLAYGGTIAVVLVTAGLVVNPRIDAARSGRDFMERVEAVSAGIAELGLVGAKEQYLLELRRPSVNFGHARWREKEQEAADGARAADGLQDPGTVLRAGHRARAWS